MKHLTAMEFTTLLDGKAGAELERRAARHFEECVPCWEEWLLGLNAQAVAARSGARLLPLFPLVDQFDDRAAADDGQTHLPSLTTGDRNIVVQFRESAGGGPLRAFLVASRESVRGAIGLCFPDSGLSFEFSSSGVAELPGVTADQLQGARLELHLEELPDDAAPSPGS